MKYDISKASAPAMPNLGKGQNTPKISPFSPLKSLRIVCEPLVSMQFSVLCAHINDT